MDTKFENSQRPRGGRFDVSNLETLTRTKLFWDERVFMICASSVFFPFLLCGSASRSRPELGPGVGGVSSKLAKLTESVECVLFRKAGGLKKAGGL